MKFKPTARQQAVFDAIEKGSGNLVIQAVAGSGKTTTILNALKLIPSNQTVLMMAFNKSIEQELQERVTRMKDLPKMTIKTQNGTGFSTLLPFFRSKKIKPRIDDQKDLKIIKEMLDPIFLGAEKKIKLTKIKKLFTEAAWQEIMNEESDIDLPQFYDDYKASLVTMVALAKANGFGVKELIPSYDSAYWERLNYFYMVMDEEAEEAADKTVFAQYANKAFKESSSDIETISFDDMLYMPLLSDIKAKFTKYDWVIIDECQDTNMVTQVLIAKMLKKTGRMIAVGDKAQAIYGFRGADSAAMDKLVDRFDARVLPLDECFRCGKQIIRLAQAFMPEIQPLSTAPRGIVETYFSEFSKDLPSTVFDGQSAIIANRNVDLVAIAEWLAVRMIPFNLLGDADIAQKLFKRSFGIINRMRSMQGIAAAAEQHPNASQEELKEIGAGFFPLVKDPKKFSLKEALKDLSLRMEEIKDSKEGNDIKEREILTYYAGLGEIIQKNNPNSSYEDLRKFMKIYINKEPEDGRVTLCTVHKSKGLEFFRVFILNYQKSFFTERAEKREWLKVQERNKAYVAITRAERELIFIDHEVGEDTTDIDADNILQFKNYVEDDVPFSREILESLDISATEN